ncbi:centriole and centriolar satellite protein OFD1-like isoform X1 [Mya arenaria]|uniref:centriole and centriolar satellite protein OFD1-like isoform X1 n=1 Tax=Mya arenaria TaxID=6604 RepID=UPI0022E6BE82|nr:centriole and centriolar satellite protein OFD1-like isoform X1 [Mya arenaria]
MSKRSEEYLTAEELRNRLYHSLRDKGLVNSMKSQLRTSLVGELKRSVNGKLSVEDLEVPESGSLVHRASNSLVADHLRSCKYDYTYSVFLPECALDKTKMLSNEDVLQLLKISPQSRLFKKMTDKGGHSRKGFLWQLLSELCSMHSQASQTTSTQTDFIKVATVSTLDEKMSVLDELFSSRREEQYRTGATALEDRLLSFQRQLEERFRNELKLEVSRVKDDEVARIRMEEKEHFRRELDKARKDLERTYQAKFDALVVRERNATERLQREQEMLEKEVYNQRQSILEEIEAVRQREVSINREQDVNSREKNLQGERLKAKENEMRQREHEIARKENEFHQRLENEMTKFKVEYQAKFLERTQNIEVREATLREGERRVAEDQGKIDSLKEEVRDKSARVNELETLLQEIRHKEVDASKHNEFLNAKLRDMCDYATIKDQNITYRNEIENLKTRMAEIMQLNERERIRQEELLRELRRPTVMAEYTDRRDRSRRERDLYDDDDDFSSRPRRYDHAPPTDPLVRQFEVQSLQVKSLNQELDDMKQTLSLTQKALKNEVYRKPQDGDTSRLVSFNLSHRSAGRSAAFSDGESDLDLASGGHRRGRRGRASPRVQDVYNDVDLDDLSAPKVSTDFTTDGDESSNQSADIVAETKYRLKSLEKEAQNLERAYTELHYNLTNPSSVPDPTRPLLRRSLTDKTKQGGSTGHHMASPSASPIPTNRPLSSTPYHQQQTNSVADADVSTDSLTELKGSSSRKKASGGQDSVPKFSLSDVSDDEMDTHGRERVERPRPITVDDLEARPGSPSIMVVQADPSSDDVPATGSASRQETKQTILPRETAPPPAKLPPLSLGTAWKPPALDSAWKTENTKAGEDNNEAESWEAEQRRKEAERKAREQEAFDRQQRELQQLQSKQDKPASPEPTQQEKSEKSDSIDPVMKQYMEMIQQKRTTEQPPQPARQESERTASQVEEDLSLTEDLKSEDAESEDDFNW